ncbi:ShlB/FhaC/HecB family hemolysin secretion/activation protein [Lusitaniella coriacea]|uniref:ShlB/FhaC/HecB family hemolysin secretion/activation protein n=1 Tax=Lusitaniella coriacea TaxID=1983105 RepID=UPI003CEC25E1
MVFDKLRACRTSADPAQIAPFPTALLLQSLLCLGIISFVSPEARAIDLLLAPQAKHPNPTTSNTETDSIAQIPDLNEDRFIQPDTEPPEPLAPEEPAPEPQEPETPPQPIPSEPLPGNIQVNSITLVGSTIFSRDDFAEEIARLEGEKVAQEALEELTDRVTERYLEAGYITSRAILDEKSLASGDIQVQVLEGRVEDIEVEGTDRLGNYVRSRVGLGTTTPINTAALENQLRLLRSDPLFENVEASLRTGSEPGSSIVVVRVTETRPFRGSASVDNYSPPSVGSERISFNASYRNLTGLGDEVAASFRTTAQGGSRTVDVLYRVPLNPMNGTLQLRTSLNWNDVVQGIGQVLDISGNSQLYDISFRQPLVRTPSEELALSVGFTHQTGQTFTFAGPFPFGFGPDAEGRSTTSVFKFGQDYVLREVSGAWALRSQFNIGTGLFDATSNESPVPDSHFFSWLGQVQRVQVLNENNFLIISADLQLSSAGLLPSQQFVIGGGQSVRGYRQNVRAADNGFRFSIEDRITLQRDEAGVARFLFIPFFETGLVWNRSNNPNTLQDQRFIAGLGAGFIWQPIEPLTIKLDYGVPLVNLSDRGENAQDDGFYFSVIYQF